jgi:hypothetical protein
MSFLTIPINAAALAILPTPVATVLVQTASQIKKEKSRTITREEKIAIGMAIAILTIVQSLVLASARVIMRPIELPLERPIRLPVWRLLKQRKVKDREAIF